MSFRVSSANWQWRYFSAADIPDVLGSIDGFIENELALPDGRVLQAVPFDFPAGGIINMYDIMEEIPPALARNLLIADFTADAPGSLFIGLAADWKWIFYFNGQKLIDTSVCGNGEAPVRATNHSLQLDYKAGRNQVVFEVFGGTYRHPGRDGGMDVAVEIIAGMPLLTFEYEPFVSFPDAEDNAVTVIFSGSRISPAAVDYRGQGSSGEWQRIYDNLGGQMRNDRKVHPIRLSDLQPDTLYEYRAVLLDDSQQLKEIYGAVNTFRTAPAPGKPFSFVASADLQNPETRIPFLEDLLGKNAPHKNDFFAFIGDLFWTSDYDLSVMDEFVMPFRKITNNQLPLVMVRGNHEIYGRESNRYFEYFTAPYPGREGYYLFRWGDVCFIVLDFCDDTGRCAPPSTRRMHDFEPYIAAEAKWLKQAVELPMCRNAKYRIVLAHGIPVGDAQKYMPKHVRQVINPVFGGANPVVQIHLWLGGHVHRPFRSIPLKNACYSMLPLDSFAKAPLEWPGVEYRFPVVITGGPTGKLGDNMQFTSIRVEVDNDGLTVSSCDRYNVEFDRFTIAPDGEIRELERTDEFKYYEY